jgi:hypothetical protein
MHFLLIELMSAPQKVPVAPPANPAYQAQPPLEAPKPVLSAPPQEPVEIDNKNVVELLKVQLVEEGELEVVDDATLAKQPELTQFVGTCVTAYQTMKGQMAAKEAEFKKTLSEEIAHKQLTSPKKRSATKRAKT